MKEIYELESKKYQLYEQIKTEEQNGVNINHYLDMIKFMNLSIESKYKTWCQNSPYEFNSKFRELSKHYEENAYFDAITFEKEELMGYTIYLKMANIIYRNPNYRKEQLLLAENHTVYYPIVMKLLKKYPEQLALKYVFAFIDPELEQKLLFGKRSTKLAIEQLQAADHLRTIDYRKLNRRGTKLDRLTNEIKTDLMNQITNPLLLEALKEATSNKKIKSFLDYKERMRV